MTQDTVITIIQTAPAAILALATLLTSIGNRRRINHLNVQINSRMDMWLAEARKLAHAEGHAAGVAAHNRRRTDRK